MSKKIIVDRIEGSYAVVEEYLSKNSKTNPSYTEKLIDVPLNDLPSSVKEGDILVVQDDGKYVIDKNMATSEMARIRQKFDAIIKK